MNCFAGRNKKAFTGKMSKICGSKQPARALLLLWCLSHCFTSAAAGCLKDDHDIMREGCACNFMAACLWDSSKLKYERFKGNTQTLKSHIPNFERLAMTSSGIDVIHICEPGQLSIMYDCNNRIPLAVTFVLTQAQLQEKASRGPFQESQNINPINRQKHNDYEGSSRHKPCYHVSFNGKYIIETNWYRALYPNEKQPDLNQDCAEPFKVETAVTIDRGHLLPANLAGDRWRETFVYTNVIPQFGKLNKGSWRVYGNRLRRWAESKCGTFPVHIIVGSVPSTYDPSKFYSSSKRYFGKAGFSDFQDPEDNYRINVPAKVWTAACCGSGVNVNSTAFFAPNLPAREQVQHS